MLVPSIDLMSGKAVQLKQGKEKVLERENVIELARHYGKFGEVAVIDLDAAMGKGDNEQLIKEICKVAKCRVGGGIRNEEKARRMLANGAYKIIIGTAANEELLSKLPKDKVIVAIDTKQGKITTEGWTKELQYSAEDFVKRFENYCSGFLYTIVDKEGLMSGTDIEAIKKIREITNNSLTAAGGISTIEEIKTLIKMNVDTQLGMSIYTGEIKLEDAFLSVLDFEKCGGLIPTVVQDMDTKQVVMVAYSNKESVLKTLTTGQCTYYSRSRNELWTKGLTSGNTQKLVTARFDCDQDALLYKVEQTGNACHLNRFSCFEEKEFTVKQLVNLLEDRKKNLPEKSYTTKLFKDEFYLKRKIMEEAFESVNYELGDGLEWEASDLVYFLLTFMVKHNVRLEDVVSNLASRTK